MPLVCPTGAMYEKFTTGAPSGHEHALEKAQTTCTYCGVGCQIDLESTRGGADRESNLGSGVLPNEGNLCVKGRSRSTSSTTPIG